MTREWQYHCKIDDRCSQTAINHGEEILRIAHGLIVDRCSACQGR